MRFSSSILYRLLAPRQGMGRHRSFGNTVPQPAPKLPTLLALGWVLAVTLIYLVNDYTWFLPIELASRAGGLLRTLRLGPYFQAFLLSRVLDLLTLAAILATAFAGGVLVIDRLIPHRDLLGGLCALAIGFWILATTTLLLGAVSISMVPLAFIGLACWFFRSPRAWVLCTRLSWAAPGSWWSLGMVALITAAAGLNLLGAMAPPMEFDELEYHLGTLADFIRAGRIVGTPHNVYSNFPQLTEMLYLLALVSRSDIAAKLLHLIFGLLAALGIYAVGRQVRSPRVGLTSAALIYCTPFVLDLSQTARIDLATTFFTVLAVGTFLAWCEVERPHLDVFLWLSALFAGEALATKWTAIAVVLLPLVGLLLVTRTANDQEPRRALLARAARYLLIATVPVLPWGLKNALLTGNPVYPFLSQVFPSPHWTPSQALIFAKAHAPTFGDIHTPAFIWSTLVDLGRRAVHYSLIEPLAVPFFLLLMPLLLLCRPLPPPIRRATSLCLVAYVGWYVLTYRPWRFLFPMFPLAAVLAAFALDNAARELWQRRLLHAVVGLLLLFSLATIALNITADVEISSRQPPTYSVINYSLGQMSTEDFVAHMGSGAFEPIVWMNHHLPATAAVLYLGETRAYYAQHRVFWSTAFDQDLLATRTKEATAPDSFPADLRAHGISHIYMNWSELLRLQLNYGYLRDLKWPVIQRMLQDGYLQPVHVWRLPGARARFPSEVYAVRP